MKARNALEEKLFAWRGWALALLLLSLMASRALSDRPLQSAALPLLALAMLWRLWAGRSIGSHSNGAVMGGASLATGGAYAWSRHPLYASNLLAAAALLLFSNSLPYWAMGLLFALAFLHHHILARAEEARLEDLHKQAWRSYRELTPMWLGPIRSRPMAGIPGTSTLREAWRRQGANLAKAGAGALILWGLSLT